MKPKIKCSKNYPGYLINIIDSNKNDLSKKIKWIEPSINNLYLQACSSFLFGNYYASIICTGILLEHTLRLAVVDSDNVGLERDISINKIDEFKSLSKVIHEAEEKQIISADDMDWWKNIASILRNKSAHYLLPVILKKVYEDEKYENYQRENMKNIYQDQYYENILLDWGSFYDKDDRKIAKVFLNEAYEKIVTVINNTNWGSDESWWTSQKVWYDHFFDDNWESENVIENMYEAYKPHPKIELVKK